MSTASPHFAEDPELLEEFVLGRLDRMSTERCEQHLRTCEVCREAVDEERMIAAGAKRYGRDQIKARLRTRLGEVPTRRVPWPHVLSAAAILVILIGIGITQHWFTARVAPVENLEAEGPPKDLEMRNEPLPMQQPAPSSSEYAPGSRTAGKMHRQEETKAKEPDKDVGSAPAPADRAEPLLSAEGERRTQTTRSSLGKGSPREYWITGTLSARSIAIMEAPAEQTSKKDLMESARPATAPGSTGITRGRIILEQRSPSELSARFRNQRQSSGQPGIPTLMRQTEAETVMILFPAVPFDSTQLHQARVERFGADSLLISIGNQQVGYRLPASGFAPPQPDSSMSGQK